MPEHSFETIESISSPKWTKKTSCFFFHVSIKTIPTVFLVNLLFPLQSPTNHHFFIPMIIQAFHASSSSCYFHSTKRFPSKKSLKLNCKTTSNGDKVCVFLLIPCFYHLYFFILSFNCCRMIIFSMLLFLLAMVSLSVEVIIITSYYSFIFNNFLL